MTHTHSFEAPDLILCSEITRLSIFAYCFPFTVWRITAQTVLALEWTEHPVLYCWAPSKPLLSFPLVPPLAYSDLFLLGFPPFLQHVDHPSLLVPFRSLITFSTLLFLRHAKHFRPVRVSPCTHPTGSLSLGQEDTRRHRRGVTIKATKRLCFFGVFFCQAAHKKLAGLWFLIGRRNACVSALLKWSADSAFYRDCAFRGQNLKQHRLGEDSRNDQDWDRKDYCTTPEFTFSDNFFFFVTSSAKWSYTIQCISQYRGYDTISCDILRYWKKGNIFRYFLFCFF